MVCTEPIFCRYVNFWFQVSVSQLEKLASNCTCGPLMHIFLLSIYAHYHRQHWSCCQYDKTEFNIMDFVNAVLIAADCHSLHSALFFYLPFLTFLFLTTPTAVLVIWASAIKNENKPKSLNVWCPGFWLVLEAVKSLLI